MIVLVFCLTGVFCASAEQTGGDWKDLYIIQVESAVEYGDLRAEWAMEPDVYVPAPQDARIALNLAEAELSGDIRLVEHFEAYDALYPLDQGGWDTVLSSGDSESTALWHIAVDQPGLYELQVSYLALGGNEIKVQRKITIDGETPFEEANNLCFYRVFEEEVQENGKMRINAIRAAGRTGDVRAVAAQIGKLRQEVPDSDELLGAIIWYGDFLKNIGRAAEARKEFLSWHEYFADDPEKMARLLMEQALAGDASPEGDAAALEALEAAMRLTADDAVAAQLLFERAEVLNRSGDYSGAREACLQGLDIQERSPEKADPLLNAMLIMRLGDNSFQLFQRMREPAILAESIEAYRTVVDASVLPLEFRRQAACRLGRGLESAGNPGRALRVYEDTVMDALAEYTARGRVTGADWVGLCGNNAVKICLAQNSSVIGMRALKIIGAMKEMHLAFDRDWDELASEVRKKFSL